MTQFKIATENIKLESVEMINVWRKGIGTACILSDCPVYMNWTAMSRCYIETWKV